MLNHSVSLQEALRNKFVRNFVESQLHIDVDELADKLQTYGGCECARVSVGVRVCVCKYKHACKCKRV